MSNSKNISYQAIPLLRLEQVAKLSSRVALIMRSGNHPVKAAQYIWYKESAMKDLPLAASFVPTQTVQRVAFERADFQEFGCDINGIKATQIDELAYLD